MQPSQAHGPRLPLELLRRRPSRALPIPGAGVAVDASCEHGPAAAGVHPCAFAHANHCRLRPNAYVEHWPACAGEPERLALVALESVRGCPACARLLFHHTSYSTTLAPHPFLLHTLCPTPQVAAGHELRFDPEIAPGRRAPPPAGGNGGAAGGSTNWRLVYHHPPPPTCEEPVVDYLTSLLEWEQARAHGHGRGHGQIRAPIHARMHAHVSQLEVEDERPECLRPEQLSASPVAWAGPRGGDEVLRHVIGRVQSTEWFEERMRRGNAKAKLWELLATHLPGRTPHECQERWRALQSARQGK